MKRKTTLPAKSLLFIFAFALILTVSSETKAQTNLNKAIAAHINKVREDASEYRKARKIVYGDVDGDGTKDAVVQYTLEGAGGGNSWGQSLAVFLNKKGVYKMTADEIVGGKFFRSFDVLKVENKAIIGKTETCPDDQPQGLCENPAKEQVKFVLVGAKLKEQ
jgi:hypothetical protein